MNVERHYRRLTDGFEASLVVRVGRRWVRVGAFYGPPPGSHIGLWRTRSGTLRGLNVRLGRRYVGPCLTLIAHTRKRA